PTRRACLSGRSGRAVSRTPDQGLRRMQPNLRPPWSVSQVRGESAKCDRWVASPQVLIPMLKDQCVEATPYRDCINRGAVWTDKAEARQRSLNDRQFVVDHAR